MKGEVIMTHEQALSLFTESIDNGYSLSEAQNIVYKKCIELGEDPLDADAIAYIALMEYKNSLV
jgi:hypothetical protein